MCGLFLSVGFIAPAAHLDRVAHRGPDNRAWQDGRTHIGHPYVIGHRRLSIFDVSRAGDQPFASKDGKLLLIFNGAIYNHVELRTELAEGGRRFFSRSDTEVLLEAYQAWGPDCLFRLEGIFSFVVLDLQDGSVFAARDEFGVKPLYYTQTVEGLALASELKQIFDLQAGPPRLNRRAAIDFLAAAITDHEPETLVENVFQLMPGHILHWRPESNVSTHRWTKTNSTSVGTSFQEAFSNSVKQQLRRDVPIGFCLSGGLDSSSLVTEASLQGAEAMSTFTASFPGSSVDETHFANAVACQVGSESNLILPDESRLPSIMDNIVRTQDGPFPSTSILVQWFVFEAASAKGCKVMLDGQGADELMFGYHGVFPNRELDLLLHRRFGALLSTLMDRCSSHGGGALVSDLRALGQQSLRWLLPTSLRNFVRASIAGAMVGKGMPSWMNQDAMGGAFYQNPLVRFAHECRDSTLLSLENWREFMIKTGSLPMLLRYEDRNSMNFGIEARVPYLHPPLAALIRQMPPENFFDGARTKIPLRKAMQNKLSETVRERKDKIGFAAPEHRWLTGPIKTWALAEAQEAAENWPDLFDASKTSVLLSNFSRDGAEGATVWRMATFGCWTRLFLNRA